MRYATIDADGLVSNVILWDGETDYNPGPGLDLVALDDNSPVGPGDTIKVTKAGRVTLLDTATPEPVEPTLEERVAALESVVDVSQDAPPPSL